MGKGTHFFGQPVYGQLIKSLDRDKIVEMSREMAGSAAAYVVVFIALVNTVVSLYYYLLIVKAMYIKSADDALPTFRSDCNTRLALFLTTAGVLLCGVASCCWEWIAAAV